MPTEDIERTEEAPQQGQQADGGETDYKALYEAEVQAHAKTKAESRKWEGRSKENAEKARAYDSSQEASRSVEDRLAALEAENATLRQAESRAAAVRSVAEGTGVPESIVAMLAGDDEETLAASAAKLADHYKVKAGAPSAPEAGNMARETTGGGKEQALLAAVNKAFSA